MRNTHQIKRIILLSSILSLCFYNVFSQMPSYGWANRAGKSGAEDGKAITIDRKGNIYAIGSFTSDSIIFGNTALDNIGGSDVFIVKYDSTGNVVWAKRISASGDEYGRGIAVDKNENVYITGYFSTGSILFGNSTLVNSSPGTQNIFIAKIDSTGMKDWARSVGGSGDDYGQSISIDTFGYLYVTGNFYSSSITVGSTTLTQSGGSDMCLMKYDKNGNPLWAKSAGGSGYEHGFAVTNDLGGNCFVAGVFFSSTITFGSTALSNSGGGDIFITKYDSQGNVTWAIKAGGNANDDASSVCTDLSGNLYLVGGFRSSSITFGATTPLTNSGNYDFFITKIDAAGNPQWSKGAGGSNDDIGQAVTRDINGNILVTGTFSSSSITIGSTLLTNSGTKNIFIAGYNSSGTELWARKDGGSGSDESFGISSQANGKAYITGKFSSNPFTLGANSLTNNGSTDFFVAQLAYGSLPCTSTIYDTVHIAIFDTTHITSYDTTHITVYDTVHTAVTDTLIVNFHITGINPPNNLATVKVYPNPASDHLYINTGNHSNLNGYKIKITNTLSQVVFVTSISQQTYSVDLSNWTGSGTYFVSILDPNNNIVETKKIILQ